MMASGGSDGDASANYGEDRDHFKLMFTGENKDFTNFDARFALHVSARFGKLALDLYHAEWQDLSGDDKAHPAHVYFRLDIEAETGKYDVKIVDGKPDLEEGQTKETQVTLDAAKAIAAMYFQSVSERDPCKTS